MRRPHTRAKSVRACPSSRGSSILRCGTASSKYGSVASERSRSVIQLAAAISPKIYSGEAVHEDDDAEGGVKKYAVPRKPDLRS